VARGKDPHNGHPCPLCLCSRVPQINGAVRCPLIFSRIDALPHDSTLAVFWKNVQLPLLAIAFGFPWLAADVYYTDINHICVPVNFRILLKSEGQTKNKYFRDMLAEVLVWGLQPAWITGDRGLCGLDNLKRVRNHTLVCLPLKTIVWYLSLRVLMYKYNAWTFQNQEELCILKDLVWSRCLGPYSKTNIAIISCMCLTLNNLTS